MVASWCNVPAADVDVRVTDGSVRLGVSVKTDSEKSAEVSKSASKHYETKEAATASLRAHDSLSDVAVIAVARAVVKQTSDPVAKSMAVVEEEVTAKQAAANAAASAAVESQLAANEAALSCRKPAIAASTLCIVSPARHASQRRRFSLRSAALFPWLLR